MAHYRDVATRALGKPLPKGCEVHHVNGDHYDNRPCNLVICQDAAYHDLLHRRAAARGWTPHSTYGTFILRNIDDDLWTRVKAQATKEGRPLRWLFLRLLEAYAHVGLDRIEQIDP